MRYLALSIICISASATWVHADPLYAIHGNLHIGQKLTYSIVEDDTTKSTSTTDGVATPTNTHTSQVWKVSLTNMAEKDGAATQAKVDFDPGSYDTSSDNGAPAKKTTCAYAGKSITLTRQSDGTIENDFKGDVSGDDQSMLENLIIPDDDVFPNTPVAVGDVWDASEKVSRHLELGLKDQASCKCRLDWVKTIDGKQMAQISYSFAIIQYADGNVEEDTGYAETCLVDIAAGMIVKCDSKGSTKYITPAKEPTQVTGGIESIFHLELIPDPHAAPTTKP